MTTKPLPQTLVFVYGTLKRGGAWSHLLKSASFMGSGMTASRYPMLIDTIPYLLDEKGFGQQVFGELYSAPPAVMRALDALEQHPTWYQRKLTDVIVMGERTKAFIYFLTPDCYDPNWQRKTFHSVYPISSRP